jgi:hypothetical protein
MLARRPDIDLAAEERMVHGRLVGVLAARRLRSDFHRHDDEWGEVLRTNPISGDNAKDEARGGASWLHLWDTQPVVTDDRRSRRSVSGLDDTSRRSTSSVRLSRRRGQHDEGCSKLAR